MELAIAIIGLVSTMVGIWWTLHKAKQAKKAKEAQRRDREDAEISDRRKESQSEQISDVSAHEVQEKAEMEWRRQHPKMIMIHCSASPNGAGHSAKTIDRYHREERGWRKIGYHKVIQPNGFVEDDRNSPCRPESEVGAGAKGVNHDVIHICMIGTDKFPLVQLEKLKQVVLGLKAKYSMSNASIRCHYEFNGHKTCPNMNRGKLVKWITMDSKESIEEYILGS